MLRLLRGNRKKLVVIILVVLAVVFLVVAIIVARNRINSATVSVTVAPSIAKVRVGEYEFEPVGTYKIRPGEYEVEVAAEGFATKTGKLVAVADSEVEVRLYLEPAVGNENWYEEHPGDAVVMGDIRNDLEIAKFEKLKAEQPILKYVPYVTYNYRLDYEMCGEVVCVEIDGALGFRDAAVEYLQGTGVNLTGFKLTAGESLFKKASGVSGGSFKEYEMDLGAEIKAVTAVAESFAKANAANGYTAEVLQAKGYGDFCGVKVKVYAKGGDPTIYDTYRMVVAKVGGKWQAVTGVELLLYRGDNANVPTEVLELVNKM